VPAAAAPYFHLAGPLYPAGVAVPFAPSGATAAGSFTLDADGQADVRWPPEPSSSRPPAAPSPPSRPSSASSRWTRPYGRLGDSWRRPEPRRATIAVPILLVGPPGASPHPGSPLLVIGPGPDGRPGTADDTLFPLGFGYGVVPEPAPGPAGTAALARLAWLVAMRPRAPGRPR
jgi:hypothetical protein